MCVQWIFNISRYCFVQFGAHQYRKSQQHHIVLMELLMDIFLLESRTWSFRKDHNTSIKPSFFQDFAMVYIATAALNNFAYTKWCCFKVQKENPSLHVTSFEGWTKIRLMAKRSIFPSLPRLLKTHISQLFAGIVFHFIKRVYRVIMNPEHRNSPVFISSWWFCHFSLSHTWHSPMPGGSILGGNIFYYRN